MIKVAPVLIFSVLPFTNYIIFPLTYYFPRQLLCSHFWTLQQRVEFQMEYLRKRLVNHRPAFRCLQAELDKMKDDKNELFKQWASIVGYIGSGVQPTTEEIIGCKQLFQDGPYSIDNMKIHHIVSYRFVVRTLLMHFYITEMLTAHARHEHVYMVPQDSVKGPSENHTGNGPGNFA